MEYDIVILPSFSQVEAYRRRCADERGGGLFAQAATTFDAWVAGLWELHGDGRTMVDALRREVMLRMLFAEAGPQLATAGVAPLAALCLRDAAGTRELEQAVAQAGGGGEIPGLSEGELGFLRVIARYEGLLEAGGLIEPGQAAALLARDAAAVFPHPVRVLAAGEVLSGWIAGRFLQDNPAVRLTLLPGRADGAPRAPAGLDVSFAFPSGRLAQAAAIADIVREHGCEGDVVIACKDPLKMHGQLERRLAGLGFGVGVQAAKPFPHTDFGRAYLCLYHAVHDEVFDPALLADALVWPYSGFSRSQALDVDGQLRGDRLVGREAALAGLRVASERFSQLEELVTDPDADVLIGVFEQLAQSAPGRTPAWRAEQLAAMAALRGALSAARSANAGIGVCASALEAASVRVSYKVAGPGRSVMVMSQAQASQLGRGSCTTLLAADLTSEDYPVAERADAAATLLAKLGLHPRESALDRARRAFAGLLAAPTKRIVLCRPLGDSAADETYPCIPVQEFIEAHCAQAPVGERAAGGLGVPSSMCVRSSLRGEEDLYANACALPARTLQPARAEVAWPQVELLGADEAAAIAPRRRDSQGRLLDKPCPSPSQIEAYLGCPLQWFVASRLKVDQLDEGFGPLEKGTFAHEALQTFYQRFQSGGHLKVSGENIEAARALMRETLDALERAQFDRQPKSSGRLVPADELERREVEVLRRQLIGYLDFESRLLPTFHPAYFEYEIPADEPADYAGAYLVGKVDRIDVDDRGRAVIIDYKGSVNDGHEIAGKDASCAGKVQTRIYAQVVKRSLGLDVVGALYVSYGANPSVSGAYDPRVLDSAHLPGADPGKCACAPDDAEYDVSSDGFAFSKLSFDQVLEATEKLAALAVEGMCAGAIAPVPSKGSCRYCPVASCAKRGV